jgi:hypothetical protein
VGRDTAIAQIMLNRYLVKRFITVEEGEDLVAFLFGPSATSITGCNWIMDGGLTSQGGPFRDVKQTEFPLMRARPLPSNRRLDAWSWVSTSLHATLIRGYSVRP